MSYPNKNKLWDELQRKYLIDNYLSLSNADIAENLGRTTDSIRKESNKLRLKRPRKCDFPKVFAKRGRKRKIKSIAEALNVGLSKVLKREKTLSKQEDTRRKLLNEAVWAADFITKKQIPKETVLINPIVLSVPSLRLKLRINRDLPSDKIESKISAYQEKYSGRDVKIKR